MAKRVNSAKLKGALGIDFNAGKATLTKTTKDETFEYDFFALLSEFNGKTVSVSITEENDIPTIEE